VTVSEDKTRIVAARHGFDFLGVLCRKRSTRRDTRRWFCYICEAVLGPPARHVAEEPEQCMTRRGDVVWHEIQPGRVCLETGTGQRTLEILLHGAL